MIRLQSDAYAGLSSLGTLSVLDMTVVVGETWSVAAFAFAPDMNDYENANDTMHMPYLSLIAQYPLSGCIVASGAGLRSFL